MQPLSTRLQDSTCQAAVFLGAGQPLELRRFPIPAPQAGEAIVRLEYCTICGSDLHTITGARIEPTPSILGHEALGNVVAVGDPPPCDTGGRALHAGDRITWSTVVACGDCDRCQRGLPQKCRTVSKYGHDRAEGRQALSGGLAEYLLLRRGSAVVRVDLHIPASVICPVNCATATAAAALRKAGAIAGRTVLILGAGMLGLTAAAFARSSAASAVTVCDVNALRLERAWEFGADGVVQVCADPDEFHQRLRRAAGTDVFDIVLEMSGATEAVEAALALAECGAQIVLVGSVMKSRPVSLDPEQLVRRCLSLHGVHNYAPQDLEMAVAFLTKQGAEFPFAQLVEFTFPLADVTRAVETALRQRPVRVAIDLKGA
jgi:alcohol dehydrogenase